MPARDRRRAPCAGSEGTSPAVRWPVRAARRSPLRRAWRVARRGERDSSRHPPQLTFRSRPPTAPGTRRRRSIATPPWRLCPAASSPTRSATASSVVAPRRARVGRRRAPSRGSRSRRSPRPAARSTIASRPRARSPAASMTCAAIAAQMFSVAARKKSVGWVGRIGHGRAAPVARPTAARRRSRGSSASARPSRWCACRPQTSANPRRASSAAQRWSRRETATTSPLAAAVAVGVVFVVTGDVTSALTSAFQE